MKNESLINLIKLWIHVNKDNIIGVFKILVTVSLLLGSVQHLPYLTRSYLLSRLDAETIGVIDTIEKRKGIVETHEGGKVIVKDYKIDYHFLLDGERVNRSEIIVRNSMTLKQKVRLNEIAKGDSVFVKYDSNNARMPKLLLEDCE